MLSFCCRHQLQLELSRMCLSGFEKHDVFIRGVLRVVEEQPLDSRGTTFSFEVCCMVSRSSSWVWRVSLPSVLHFCHELLVHVGSYVSSLSHIAFLVSFAFLVSLWDTADASKRKGIIFPSALYLASNSLFVFLCLLGL